MGRIVNELDTINFSIKKASQLVKEIGRQVSSFLIPLSKCNLFSIYFLQATYMNYIFRNQILFISGGYR